MVASLLFAVPGVAAAQNPTCGSTTPDVVVPQDYATIAAAIAAAPAGGVIHVEEGIYPTTAVVGKNLTIRGCGGSSNSGHSDGTDW